MIIKSRWKFIFLFVVFALVLILRFYNLEKNVKFGWDQESTAIQIKSMVDNRKPTLVGPRIGPATFFLPPFYYYYALPFLMATKFNPLGLYYGSSILGIISAIVIFWCAHALFNQKTGLLAALIYLYSPLMIVFDRAPWNVNFIVISAAVCYLALLDMVKNKATIWNNLLLGFALGIACSAHFTGIFLIIISVVWLILNKKLSKNLIYSVAIVMLFVFPLIVFDFRHNFFNYNAILDFFRGNKEMIPIPLILKITRFTKNLFILLELLGSFFIGNVNFWGKSILGILGILFFFFKFKESSDNQKKFYQLFCLSVLVSCFLFTYYNGAIPEYYFFFLCPLFILACADIITNFIKDKSNFRIILVSFSILLIFFIRDFNIIKATASDGLFFKQKVINHIGDSPVKITYIMASRGDNVGFNYLLNLKNIIVDNNAKKEAIIKFPVIGDIRQTDYKQYGNIGIKIKDSSYDERFIDYWDQRYQFAFDLPKEFTVINCDWKNNEYFIVDRVKGSCFIPFPAIKDQMRIIIGEDNKLAQMYFDFNGNEFQISNAQRNSIYGKKIEGSDNLINYAFIVPRHQENSLLFDLKIDKNDQIMYEKLIQIIAGLRTYAD